MAKKKKPSQVSRDVTHGSEQKIDKSPYVAQNAKIDFDLKVEMKYPLTDTQKKFIELATNPKVNLIIAEGPAGAAKTFTAAYCALKRISEKKSSDLIYIRSLVQSKDGETGFLTGDLNEKLHYYNVPMADKLTELLSEADIRRLHKENRIKTFPTSLIRGNSWNAQDIIADEMQNALFTSLVTIATRVGKYSKCYILGDSMQNDFGQKSGFRKFYELFDDEESKEHGIYTIKFTKDDIVRSELVKFIIEKVEKSENK